MIAARTAVAGCLMLLALAAGMPAQQPVSPPSTLRELVVRVQQARAEGQQTVPESWFDVADATPIADTASLQELLALARATRQVSGAARCVSLLLPLLSRSGEPWDGHRDEIQALLVDRLLVSNRLDAVPTYLEPLLKRQPPRDPERDPIGLEILRVHACWLLATRRFHEAEPLYARVVDIVRGSADHSMLRADLDQLGRAKHYQGDRQGAYDAFAESLALARASMPAAAPALLSAMNNLGSSMAALGDYRGAYELCKEILAIRERTLPPDDPKIVYSLQSSSQLLVQLDDLDQALALQQRALAIMQPDSARFGDMYLDGLQYLARIHHAREDFDDSYRVGSQLLPMLESRRPASDRDLGTLRSLLGVLERRRGDIEASRRLLEASLAGLRQALPMDHSFTQIAAGDLLTTCRLQGDTARSIELAELLLQAAVDSLDKTLVAARPTASLAKIQYMGVEAAFNLCVDGVDATSSQRLLQRALEVSQQRRGAAIRVAQRANRQRWQASQSASIRQELEGLASRIQAATVRGDAAELARIAQRRDELELALLREQRDGVAGGAPELPTAGRLAAALPARSAAVAIVPFWRRVVSPGAKPSTSGFDAMAALVLVGDGTVRFVDLGARNALLDAIDDLRPSRHKQLRATYLDPILAAAGDVETLFLALDESWQLVPWDALPLSSGAPVGTRVELRRLTSLLDLVNEATPMVGNAALLVGDVDYAAAPARTVIPDSIAQAPPIALLRGGEAAFPALPGSAAETDAIGDLLRAAFPTAELRRYRGDAATKPALAAAAAGATFVHFATHGYLTSESAIARRRVELGELSGVGFAMTPYALCGIAVSGANRGPQADGSVPGLLTGEELQGWDLSRCYLAVLSACESGLGMCSDGQGLASLQAALHIAGARYVVATVAAVEDEAARLVTTELYRRLLQDPERPYQALWQARMVARERGVAFRDWASFQMSSQN